MIIDKVANANAPVLTLNAPLTPKRLILKKTLTTSAFNGIPNKFMITLLCESGTYLLLNVPMDGKYIPTQPSNAKKAPTMAANGIATIVLDADTQAAMPIAIVATASILLVKLSVGTFFFTSCPKIVEPNKQLAMKQEKTVPYGVELPFPNTFETALEIAGGHCKTKIYIAASNNDCTAPTNIIFRSALTTLIASRIVGSLSSPLDDLDTSALFSFHKKVERSAPAAKNAMDNSNGPVGPRLPAAAPANCPARIATIESPAYACMLSS